MRIGGYRRLRGPAPAQQPPTRPPARPAAAPQVLWRGPCGGVGAMPRVTYETVAALRRLGIAVALAGAGEGLGRGPFARQRRLPLVAVHVQWAPVGFWGGFLPAARKVAYTFCESTALAPPRRQRLQSPDLILVPSTFCARVFQEALAGLRGRPRVAVAPHGAHVDAAYVPPPADGPTIFLSIAAPGRRKGRDVLADAFPRAFPEGRDVELWLAGGASYPGTHPGIRPLGVLSDDALRAAIRAAHCLVFPTRGEGFCLPALEGGALGRPSILTDWSGHLDFVDEEVGYLVAVRCLVPRDDGGLGCGLWAEPSVDSLVAQLRAVHADREEAARRGRRLRERVRAAWTWDHAARRLAVVLGLRAPDGAAGGGPG